MDYSTNYKSRLIILQSSSLDPTLSAHLNGEIWWENVDSLPAGSFTSLIQSTITFLIKTNDTLAYQEFCNREIPSFSF